MELRAAREAAGLTQEQTAQELEWSLSKIIRIEAGTVRVAVTDVRVLLQTYGVTGERVDNILTLARAAREQGWWHAYRKVVSQQLFELIGYESAASVIRQFEPLIVPGLLQTSAYAREILFQLRGEESADKIDDLVDVRIRRQEIFERPDPPQFFYVLDESAVHRLVGGTAMMRAQLAHLLEMAKQPNVTIEIVPFNAGAHAGLAGSFHMLDFAAPEDDPVLYLEGVQGEIVGRDFREDFVRYRERFELLRGMSLGPEGTAVLLSGLAEKL
ncbi:helix-turn-helix domain-containing protein [Actinomadura sp. 21ATH]|uniref:helix-turn-helix domain-containing protein n=1 Tax=Actinomadura sp. 21ATH TaxID=1735444 RepID=UPI0035C135D2